MVKIERKLPEKKTVLDVLNVGVPWLIAVPMQSLDNWNIVHKVLIYVFNIFTIKIVGLKLLRGFSQFFPVFTWEKPWPFSQFFPVIT